MGLLLGFMDQAFILLRARESFADLNTNSPDEHMLEMGCKIFKAKKSIKHFTISKIIYEGLTFCALNVKNLKK